MGLKLLKWVYELGVQQERTRIARHLEWEMSHRSFDQEVRMMMLTDEDSKMSKSRKEKLARSADISREVTDIIDRIFRGEPVNHAYTSIMFPEEEKKL